MKKRSTTEKTYRKPWYERGYRKTKNAMYEATEEMSRGGVRGFLGRIAFLLLLAMLIIAAYIGWLVTLGGRLIKEKTQIRSQND